MKNKIIQIKTTDEEKKKIEEVAERVSLPTSAYCRYIILKNLEVQTN